MEAGQDARLLPMFCFVSGPMTEIISDPVRWRGGFDFMAELGGGGELVVRSVTMVGGSPVFLKS